MEIIEIFNQNITVADCFVCRPNKIGAGNGEAKLYLGPRSKVYERLGGKGFTLNCFMFKQDLLNFMRSIKTEYCNPTRTYKNISESIWKERYEKIKSFPDLIEFKVIDTNAGGKERGYITSSDKGYMLIRELALPLVSYLSIMEVKINDNICFYWKLFTDFDAIENKDTALVYTYGKKKNEDSSDYTEESEGIIKRRPGQSAFKKNLINECVMCPFTGVDDSHLLIASHIKPFSVCEDKEKYDVKNGFLFTPTFDKLFDKGYISFKNDKTILLSQWLSAYNWNQLGLKGTECISKLPLDSERIKYLEYHRDCVFKG